MRRHSKNSTPVDAVRRPIERKTVPRVPFAQFLRATGTVERSNLGEQRRGGNSVGIGCGSAGVSDPGQDLVDLVLEATSTSGGGGGGGGDASVNNVVVPIPGASAVTTAVIEVALNATTDINFVGFFRQKRTNE